MHEVNETPKEVNNLDENVNDLFLHQQNIMERKATNYFAAKTIANSNFPNEDTLPRFSPTPFNNFGHYFLLDYQRYLKILWDTVEQFKSEITPKDRNLPWVVFGVSLVIFIFIPRGLILSVVLFFITKGVINRKKKKKYADIRANLIKELLDDTWKPSKEHIPITLEKNFSLVGSGDIHPPKTPVVIIFNELHPFPGFGQLQLENLFICRPKNKKENLAVLEEKLFDGVIAEIRKDLKNSGLENYNTGHLISIRGNSIRMNSKWLNNDKIPLLYYDSENIYDYDSVDNKASSRLFFAVQILLPKYMTAASFFVRVYKAENAAACQISVTTLGPPNWKSDFFQKRLAKYKSEKEKKRRDNFFVELIDALIPDPKKNIAEMKLFQELRHQKELGKDESVFSSNPKLREIRKLDLVSLKTQQDYDYKKEYNEVIKENVDWVGQYYYPLNWREQNSLTFPSDFFGRPEAIGAVKTIYDQISRSVLDSFEDSGFDVSDYKDKDGNYSINADKIEQIIIGEKIKINKEDE